MSNTNTTNSQIRNVSSFEALVNTPLFAEKNALCWNRKLEGDFEAIVNCLEVEGNMRDISIDDLLALQLSEQGQVARTIIINDFNLLKEQGASPVLNLIKHYERDDAIEFFPTDVYSFHVDRSPIPTDTFLCTYYGAASDILPNAEAIQKIQLPEIRNELEKIYDGAAADFDTFLSEHFFDLHYIAKPNANIINLGIGTIWRLACECPEYEVLPCIHRAPIENNGEYRLLLIC